MIQKSIYDIEVTRIDGKNCTLRDFKGFTLLIVNVASKCRLAEGAYKAMTSLLSKFYNSGLRILLFPCSQFLNQEFNAVEDIKKFTGKYNEHFDLMNKVKVNGADAHPLFKFLCKNLKGSFFSDSIKWNFTYFLIGPKGELVKRYGLLQGCPTENDKNLLKCLKETEKNIATAI
ncbi:Phospholipid hydroperoxide glutathione peroxidase [Glugoides intestinalis]